MAGSTAKVFLFILATLSMAGGAYLIVMGSAAMGDTISSTFIFLMSISSGTEQFLVQMQNTGAPNIFNDSGVEVLIYGCCIVFLAILSYVAAGTESRPFLITMGVLLGLLSIGLIYPILAANERPANVKADNVISDRLNADLDRYEFKGLTCIGGQLTQASEKWTQSWDIFQFGSACCGSTGSDDWVANATNWNRDGIQYPDNAGGCNSIPPDSAVVPLSCCKVTPETDRNDFFFSDVTFEDAQQCLLGNTDYINEGCSDVLQTTIDQYSNRIMGVSIAVGVIQLFTVICCVLVAINPSYSTMKFV